MKSEEEHLCAMQVRKQSTNASEFDVFTVESESTKFAQSSGEERIDEGNSFGSRVESSVNNDG